MRLALLRAAWVAQKAWQEQMRSLENGRLGVASAAQSAELLLVVGVGANGTLIISRSVGIVYSVFFSLEGGVEFWTTKICSEFVVELSWGFGAVEFWMVFSLPLSTNKKGRRDQPWTLKHKVNYWLSEYAPETLGEKCWVLNRSGSYFWVAKLNLLSSLPTVLLFQLVRFSLKPPWAWKVTCFLGYLEDCWWLVSPTIWCLEKESHKQKPCLVWFQT